MKTTKSFLKWAGGKSQSIGLIQEHVYSDVPFFKENRVKRFIEPFVGSGVVFLNITADEYIISDVNEDLINIYKILKKDNTYFIDECRKLFKEKFNNEDEYYKLRTKFNQTTDTFERAVIFIYLNRHCFNGLCRFNKSGGFNVPFGRYTTINFPERALNVASVKLQKVTVYKQSFEDTMSLAKEGDIIYLDPPYVPLSGTASFTDYSTDGFSMKQQELLAKLIEEAPCKCLVSNHDTPITRELYKNASVIETKSVSRFISAKANSRNAACELLAVYNKGI